MVVMAFDLSSTCIGVITARINQDHTVGKVLSCPIVPPEFDATTLGFFKNKRKLKTVKGLELNSWAKPGETMISQEEKKHRDSVVRSKKDISVLSYIGKSIDSLTAKIKPDLILVEKNAIFNGVLTSVLLGKVMGVLVGISGITGCQLIEYPVTVIRSIYPVGNWVVQFSKEHTPEELIQIPDVTKRVIGIKLGQKYGVRFQTDDESDACAVFDYWYEKVYKKSHYS